MNLFHYLSAAQVAAYASLTTGNNDALIPDLWAQEGLLQLEESMVAGNLVRRDFENDLAEFGDVVNTRRPKDFKIRRRTDNSGSTSRQNPSLTNVKVPMDQWFETKFIINDAEASKSMKDLVEIHLVPAARTLARAVDRAVLGRVHAYLANRAGRLENLDKTNASDFVLDAREQMNKNKCPEMDRRLILSPSSETPLHKTDLFVSAEKRGDGGNALENARMGRIHGFQTYLGLNTPSHSSGDIAEGTVTDAQSAGEGGSQAVTITGYVVNVGEYATVAGNDQPTHVTAKTDDGTDTSAVTMNEDNKFSTEASAVIKVYKAASVKKSAGYAVDHTESIVLDGWDTAPQVGQLLAHGTGNDRVVYTIIEAEDDGTDATIWLDRPLEKAMSDDDLVFPGPAGSYNWAFHRDALALVTRPLALPSAGVVSQVISYNGLSMRASIQHDIDESGTVVKLDMLCGIAVLDENLGVMLLG